MEKDKDRVLALVLCKGGSQIVVLLNEEIEIEIQLARKKLCISVYISNDF